MLRHTLFHEDFLVPRATSGARRKSHLRSGFMPFAIPKRAALMSALGHVWTAPSWQGLSSRTQHWSVQPCVRPVDAVHMTAGHNALRGSGPGQKLAFDNALALVGCPDRRIDRLCIACCSPSQLSHHIECPMRSRSRRKRSGFFVAFAPSRDAEKLLDTMATGLEFARPMMR